MKRKRLHVLGLVVFTTFFYRHFSIQKSDIIRIKPTMMTNVNDHSSAVPFNHVTKSMAELGKMDEINRYFLFLNHVPKCGSEILVLLMQHLQGVNGFKHVRLKGGNQKHLTIFQQEQLVDEMYYAMKTEAIPLSFDRHAYFVNFTKFDKQLPIYINLVRNPVDRILSRFAFKNNRKSNTYKCLINDEKQCSYRSGLVYDLSIPYFCGQDRRCPVLNDAWALQQAKENVEKYFPVVGILEELNTTLQVLEKNVPYFFTGVQKTYQEAFFHIPKFSKPEVPLTLVKKLKKSLVKEMEFYEWLTSRLFNQLRYLYDEGHSH